MSIKTRFSPSPTGYMHLGNARAALFSALLAKKEKGIFLLRIEDTDLVRSEHKFTEILQDDLHWLGITWQEGPDIGGPHAPYWQSERHEIYNNYYQRLIEADRAYPCFCTDQELAINRKLQLSRGQAPRYPGTCRKLSKADIEAKIGKGLLPALRFVVPPKTIIEFIDLVKGPQKFNSDDIGDFIIRRKEGTSSFMFSNAIDDSLMGVTHVLRGDDHLSNTPRQLMILNMLGLRVPQYGHLSLITGDDGGKLSKRHGSFSVEDLRREGYLPKAVLNYLSRLGHTFEQKELMDFDTLAAHFTVEKLSRASARFDKHQLLHWQKEAVMQLDNDATKDWLKQSLHQKIPTEKQALFFELMKHNISLPEEANKWSNIFFGEEIGFIQNQTEILKSAGEEYFIIAQESIKKHGVDLKTVCDELKNKLNISGKKLFLPLRSALTGEQNGPELAHIATLLGIEKMQRHLDYALELVRK